MQSILEASRITPKAALYIRLSREDGDKTESLSVVNQRMKLENYIKKHPEISDYECYIDDGYTGTNFDRPFFQKMCRDIETGLISIVIVKDLSRLGRNMPKVTELVHDYFPSKGIRFIAIDDGIDKQFFDLNTSEDMMIDIKNMFNGFYPKDISKKVRSTFRTKQHAGQFIGAFACYGYKKSPLDHNQLIIDEPAAIIVRKIFSLYLSGKGQNTIAKLLNDEGIPCPSEYKKRCGLNYRNCRKLEDTTYWTYSSVRNILRNRIYTGTMVQNRSFRQVCKKKSIKLPEEKWIVVPNTHEAIIDHDTFEKVQKLLSLNTKHVGLNQNIHIFAGLLKCGNCGRAMTKITRKGITTFSCSSYNRYGTKYCSAHNIKESTIEEIIIQDFHAILASINDLQSILDEEQKKHKKNCTSLLCETSEPKNEIYKLQQKKEQAYEDYLEGILSKEEYIAYKTKYELQISTLREKISSIHESKESNSYTSNQWIERLVKQEHMEKLDRETVVTMVDTIYIYDNNRIKIVYNFSTNPDDTHFPSS